MTKKIKEYTLYKGNDLLAMGTIQQIAEQMKVKDRTIKFYTTPTYKRRCKDSFKRLTIVKI